MQKLIPNIPVADVERSVEFYRHVLGFDLIAVRGRGDTTRAHLKLGDVEVIFRSLDVYAPMPYLDPALENQLILHIQVEDVVQLFNRIRDQVRIVRSLEPTLFGSAEFMIRDVDGRILAFNQPVGSSSPTRTQVDVAYEGPEMDGEAADEKSTSNAGAELEADSRAERNEE